MPFKDNFVIWLQQSRLDEETPHPVRIRLSAICIPFWYLSFQANQKSSLLHLTSKSTVVHSRMLHGLCLQGPSVLHIVYALVKSWKMKCYFFHI